MQAQVVLQCWWTPTGASTHYSFTCCLCSEDIFKEIDILCGLDHENVVALKEYFEEGTQVATTPGPGGSCQLCQKSTS